MKRLKKVGMCLWAAIPLLYLASFKQMEVDALDRAYAAKECQYQAYEYREKDYQKRFDEGYERDLRMVPSPPSIEQKLKYTLDALMGTLEEMGLFDQEKEVKKEDVKAALHSR